MSIVNRHTLSLDAYQYVHVLTKSYTVGHTNGHLLSTYPWAVGLFAIPAVVVIDLLHLAGGPSADSIAANQSQVGVLVQLWTASIITGMACGALALLAYRRLSGPAQTRRRWALCCGLAFAFATSAWSTASRALWEHGPSLLFLAIALVALDRLFPRGRGGHAPRRGFDLGARHRRDGLGRGRGHATDQRRRPRAGHGPRPLEDLWTDAALPTSWAP